MKASTFFHGMALCAMVAGTGVHAAGTTATAVASPASVSVETFFASPVMSGPILSPDGSALAVLVRNKAGRRQLAVIDTADLSKIKIVASFEDFDIEGARWVNSRRLVFGLYDESAAAEAQQFEGDGLYAVDRDGENFRLLIRLAGHENETASMVRHRELPPDQYGFDRTLADDSDDVVVWHYENNEQDTSTMRRLERTGQVPVRLNTRTGELHDMVKGAVPDNTFDWAIDDQGRVAAAMRHVAGESMLVVPEAGSWKERARFPAYGTAGGYSLMDEVAADGTVFAEHSANSSGASALFKLDLATGTTESRPLVSVQGFDVDAVLVEDDRAHKLLGVRYRADADGTAWFDPAMKAVQAKLDARLPGLVNTLVPARCGCAPRMLVMSASDRQPPLYFLYEAATDSLIPIGSARPGVDPRQMADTDFFRIKARDGNDLPVYVTRPHGKGPWPTVVLVHGGPFLRGWHWNWEAESQFLASRGYLVVRPEFRGSRGYGSKLYRSGFRQWGLAMQDDIADATLWAAKQGLADPARTCIAGASYGGYATLMGLVRYPELYRCGVAWAAVTDINLMYDVAWSDLGSDYREHGMPTLVGDQKKDAAQLEATSPLKQASRITRPLLLAHGGVDRRVPIVHATKLRDALEANHAPLTWIEYKDEAHGWSQPQTRADFYRRMEAFLAANMGPAATTTAAAAAEPAPASAAAH
jgi:dienelactone hydrolase